jgi:hypothetical protein
VRDVLNVILGSNIDGNYTLRIIDAKGVQVLQRSAVNTSTNVLSISTTSLSKGVYMLEIVCLNGNRETARFVKQ